jgi:hypothetical protein
MVSDTNSYLLSAAFDVSAVKKAIAKKIALGGF